MIDNLKTDLVIRAAMMSPEEILTDMGYHNPRSANYERLQAVLDSPEFGRDEGGYDFRYTS